MEEEGKAGGEKEDEWRDEKVDKNEKGKRQ